MEGSLLSIGGRVTLIKSTLSNLPLYYMSLFPIPKWVFGEIIKIKRQFLWSGNKEKKSLPWLNSDTVELPKALGGLNIGNLLHRNLALLFKGIWWFFNNPNLLWCCVVQEKYKYPPQLSPHYLVPSSHGGPWRGICSSIFLHPSTRKPCSQRNPKKCWQWVRYLLLAWLMDWCLPP